MGTVAKEKRFASLAHAFKLIKASQEHWGNLK